MSIYSEFNEQNAVERRDVDRKIDAIIQNKKFDKILFKVFTEYVQRHQKLLKYIEDVDDFFSKYFIVKLSVYITYSVLVLYLTFLVRSTKVL